MNKKQLNIIKNYIEINGGATLDNRLNFTALKYGYMVSLQGYELKTTLKNLSNKMIKKYQKIATEKNAFIGFWMDGGALYLDISINILNKMQAIATGRKNKQLAIYDLKENQSIYIN